MIVKTWLSHTSKKPLKHTPGKSVGLSFLVISMVNVRFKKSILINWQHLKSNKKSISGFRTFLWLKI